MIRLLKFMIELTLTLTNRQWDYKLLLFKTLNLVKSMTLCCFCIYVCYVFVVKGIIPVFLILSAFYRCINLAKQSLQFYNTLSIFLTVNSFPNFQREENAEVDCTICMMPIEENAKTLNCGHPYHTRCIKYIFNKRVDHDSEQLSSLQHADHLRRAAKFCK